MNRNILQKFNKAKNSWKYKANNGWKYKAKNSLKYLVSSTAVIFSQPSGGSLTNGHDFSSLGLLIWVDGSGDDSTSPVKPRKWIITIQKDKIK